MEIMVLRLLLNGKAAAALNFAELAEAGDAPYCDVADRRDVEDEAERIGIHARHREHKDDAKREDGAQKGEDNIALPKINRAGAGFEVRCGNERKRDDRAGCSREKKRPALYVQLRIEQLKQRGRDKDDRQQKPCARAFNRLFHPFEHGQDDYNKDQSGHTCGHRCVHDNSTSFSVI